MWLTRLATKVFHLVAGDLNQASTTIESVHSLTLLKLIFKALEEAWYMSANNMAAQSSNHGRDSLFNGVTLDLEQSNLVVMFPKSQQIEDIYRLHRLVHLRQKTRVILFTLICVY